MENKTNLTELVFILDRSGSMHGLEADTVGGFNSMLQKQKQEAGKAFVTTVLFDDRIEVLHDRADMQTVNLLTEKEYFVRGCTALLDAIGTTIRHIADIHKYARSEDIPAKTLFVIMTDGMENASRHYSAARVKEMIEHEKEKYGWEFLFLGANIDALETAGNFGIQADCAANYCSDSTGTLLNYAVLSDTISAVRCGQSVPKGWKSRIDADFKRRKKR